MFQHVLAWYMFYRFTTGHFHIDFGCVLLCLAALHRFSRLLVVGRIPRVFPQDHVMLTQDQLFGTWILQASWQSQLSWQEIAIMKQMKKQENQTQTLKDGTRWWHLQRVVEFLRALRFAVFSLVRTSLMRLTLIVQAKSTYRSWRQVLARLNGGCFFGSCCFGGVPGHLCNVYAHIQFIYTASNTCCVLVETRLYFVARTHWRVRSWELSWTLAASNSLKTYKFEAYEHFKTLQIPDPFANICVFGTLVGIQAHQLFSWQCIGLTSSLEKQLPVGCKSSSFQHTQHTALLFWEAIQPTDRDFFIIGWKDHFLGMVSTSATSQKSFRLNLHLWKASGVWSGPSRWGVFFTTTTLRGCPFITSHDGPRNSIGINTEDVWTLFMYLGGALSWKFVAKFIGYQGKDIYCN